jgi:tryptophan 2,3-dioxygenase
MSKAALTYTQYLKIDELLSLNHPQSDEHDEPLFIAIHQVYELWFKQVLWEMSAVQRTLEEGNTFASLATLGRVRTILKVCVSQLDILETMTPLQYNTFRDRLTSGSGFQSAQFRELEAVLGRRDHAGAGAGSGTGMGMSEHLVAGSPARARVEAAMARPSLWDSTLTYLASRGHDIPADISGSSDQRNLIDRRTLPSGSSACANISPSRWRGSEVTAPRSFRGWCWGTPRRFRIP